MVAVIIMDQNWRWNVPLVRILNMSIMPHAPQIRISHVLKILVYFCILLNVVITVFQVFHDVLLVVDAKFVDQMLRIPFLLIK